MMTKRKGFAPLIGIVVVAIIAIAVIAIPGLGSSIAAAFGEPQDCVLTPYASNCFCQTDQDKLFVLEGGITRYFCEDSIKFVNPDVSGWETEAINYAEQTLGTNYPDCNMNTCSNGQWVVDIDYTEDAGRNIEVECVSLDRHYSGTVFDVETGNVMYDYCSNYDGDPQGTPTITVRYKGGYPINTILEARVNCEDGLGIATTTYTYTLPETYQSVEDWRWFYGDPTVAGIYPSGTCTIISTTDRSMTLNCIAECTGYGGSNTELWYRYTRNIYCGNGVLDIGEECDDGNTWNGDGCPQDCNL